MLHRVQVTDTSQHQLFREDCVNQAFMVDSVLWFDDSKFEIFGSNRRVFVRCSVGEWMITACVVSTVKHEGGGVMVWGVLCW